MKTLASSILTPIVIEIVRYARTRPQLLTTAADGSNSPVEELLELRKFGVDV